MLLTDTHCHLDRLGDQPEIDAVVRRAVLAGVERILVPGTDLESSRTAVHLAESYPQVFAAVGNHPNDGEAWQPDTLAELEALSQHPKVVAIGEIGLDFYRPYTPHPLQREILQAQLGLAQTTGLPVIIHSRQSLADLLPALAAWKRDLERAGSPLTVNPGVLHSFEGDRDSAARAVSQGFLLGISGPVTYRNAVERREVLQSLDLNRILIETDSPYLTPHPHRGKPNEPGYVRYIAEKIAELREMSLEQVASQTWRNAERLFSWGATV